MFGVLQTNKNESMMSLVLITNKSTIFSQRAVITSRDNKYNIIYSTDFDQAAREKEIEDKENERKREEAAKLAEAERIRKEQEEKRLKEEAIKKAREDFNKGQNRLKDLFNLPSAAMFDAKKTGTKSEAFKNILNENLNLEEITAYNYIKIANNRSMYFYQEQIIDNKASNIFIKEKILTLDEYNKMIEELNKLVGYSGTGVYQDSIVLEIKYADKTKNVLLKDLNNILEKHNFKLI